MNQQLNIFLISIIALSSSCTKEIVNDKDYLIDSKIHGLVLDADNNTPIKDATIILWAWRKDCSTACSDDFTEILDSLTTDSTGSFEFQKKISQSIDYGTSDADRSDRKYYIESKQLMYTTAQTSKFEAASDIEKTIFLKKK